MSVLLFYMLDKRDNFNQNKPFRIGEYQLPGILDLAAQLEFSKTTLSNPDLIFYAQLPEVFEHIEIPDDFLEKHNTALVKLRVLFTLLEEAQSKNLEDSIEQAVEVYRNAYPNDLDGLEVVSLDGNLILTIYNGDQLAFQVVLVDVGNCWKVLKCMTHFRLYGYNIEIRDNLQGNELIIIHTPIENLGILPEVRDYAAIASIKIPTEQNNEDWFIQVFDLVEMPQIKGEMFDKFVIAPYRSRQIDIYINKRLTEQMFVKEVDTGISLDLIVTEQNLLPSGYEESRTIYTTTIDDGIYAGAQYLRDKVLTPDNQSIRTSLIRRTGLNVPASTKVEYFSQESIRTVELRMTEKEVITSIIVNGIVYIRGEFSLFLSPDGYSIYVIDKTQERIPVIMAIDYSIRVPNIDIKPVFDVVSGTESDLSFTRLTTTVSLN